MVRMFILTKRGRLFLFMGSISIPRQKKDSVIMLIYSKAQVKKTVELPKKTVELPKNNNKETKMPE